ncbi:MAG: hypothetical protein KME45_03465 [Stenomitos rutilans HA7619-LM2]|jgi:hypothetical protein|nr:hypothetical protein [Stenomitos rutilans HA7619-LM2]MBW4469444.1 hypothetical protein [Stenomitos rutilans HA7619-LM2]
MNINLFKASADRLFTNLGLNNTQIRFGDSKILTPNPLVTPMGIQPDAPVSSELTIQGQGYETYQVSIPDDTLIAVFGNMTNAIAAMASNNIWYVDRGDTMGWRRCRTWGTPAFNTIGKYQVTLKEMGANDYGV